MNKTSPTAFSILLVLGLVLPTLAESQPIESIHPVLKVNVRIFNYADVPSAVFTKAQKQAGRIFSRSGIVTNWIECFVPSQSVKRDPRCTAKPKADDIVMRIVSKAMIRSRPHSEFGIALIPRDGGFGKHASVFYIRLDEYTERWQASKGLLLGHLVAHEMGHLLLGANSHSASGLMHAPWSRKTIESASRGTLFFTSQEATRMQQQVTQRMEMAGSPRNASD